MPVLFSLQLDPENTGFIGVETFASLVHSHELPLDPAKLDMLVALAQGNDEGQVCYQELVDLVSAGVTRRWERVGATLCGVGWGGVGTLQCKGARSWRWQRWPQALSADQQQALEQLQTCHRQRAASPAPGWAPR